MRPKLLALAADLGRRGQACALVTVVRRESPSSAQLGDSAVITASGEFHGWLGGSCTRPTAVREALAAIRAGEARIIALSPHPERDQRPQVRPVLIACHSGGSVDLFIEPMMPAPRLLVFGLSPAAHAIVRIAKVLEYTTAVVDPEATRASYPEADWVLSSLGAPEAGWLSAADPSPLFAVVATLGERDEEALTDALRLEPAYLGMVASRKRLARVRSMLLQRGVSPALLDRIRSPAGLDIGAVSPEEIALSVLAEIVQLRRAGTATTVPGEPTTTSELRYAIDPVCHMEVEIATAKYKADVGGETYYFCCGGCRERFLASHEPQVLTR
ncbi:MAG TPA: XdhC family protein [Gemmatimonadales bacterium]|nr:XdhC family protein [Gemmatimonadales bacterium]